MTESIEWLPTLARCQWCQSWRSRVVDGESFVIMGPDVNNELKGLKGGGVKVGTPQPALLIMQ